MKVFLFALVFLPFQAFSQMGLIWSDTFIVNQNPSFGHTRPRIVLAKNGIPVISWGKTPNQGVSTSRLNGSSFKPAALLTPAGVTAFVYDWAGPEIGGSGDTVFVAFKAQPEDEAMVYVARSVDGGQNFSDTIRVSGQNWSRFPSVAVAPGGKPFVTFMKFDNNFEHPRFTVTTSNDGGSTFENDVEASILAPGEACDCCPGFIGVEKDYVYTLFRNNDNNLRDIWAAVSTDGGATFGTGADIDQSNWTIGGCPSTGPDAIIFKDSILFVWMSGATGSSRIYLGTAHKNTLDIGKNELLTPGIPGNANQNFPRIAGSGDTLGIVWQESHAGKTIVKMLFSITGPEGLLNKTPDTVSVNLSGAQKNPDIKFFNSTFHITWQDDNKKAVVYRTATLSASAGIHAAKEENPFSIYPNPSNTHFNLEFNDNFDFNAAVLTLSDLIGKTIYSGRISSAKEHIPLGQFPEGIYILSVENGKNSYRQKIILAR